MKLSLRHAAALVGVVLSFSLGAITSGEREWFHSDVKITILNVSGLDITNLKLVVNTDDVTSTSEINSLAHGDKKLLRIYVAGEAGYSIEATLSNGTIIKGGAGYVESGYIVTEKIGSNSIESSHHRGL